MNGKQKIVLWVGIAVIVLMGLFPPVYYSGGGVFRPSISYEFIFDTGRPVALSNILVQWTIVAVITGGLIYTLGIDPQLFQRICQWLREIWQRSSFTQDSNKITKSEQQRTPESKE